MSSTTKHLLLPLVSLALLPLLLSSCLDFGMSGPGLQQRRSTVMVDAKFTNTRVSKATSKPARIPSGVTIDSIVLRRASFMLFEVSLQEKGHTIPQKVMTSPVIVRAEPGAGLGRVLSAQGSVLTGTFNKFDFNFHPFTDQEIEGYVGNHTDFDEFISPERYTVIIEGTIYINGQPQPFTFGSRLETEMKGDIDLSLENGEYAQIEIILDPTTVFKNSDSGAILDPRDPTNQTRIDTALKASLLVLKE